MIKVDELNRVRSLPRCTSPSFSKGRSLTDHGDVSSFFIDRVSPLRRTQSVVRHRPKRKDRGWSFEPKDSFTVFGVYFTKCVLRLNSMSSVFGSLLHAKKGDSWSSLKWFLITSKPKLRVVNVLGPWTYLSVSVYKNILDVFIV